VTSDEFLDLSTLPATAAVIGEAAIGCEFASMLADMGTKVTILESLPSILTGCDAEVAKVVERAFKKRGIEIQVGVTITGHTPKKASTSINIEGGDAVGVDMVVLSVGRRARTEGLLAEGTGVVVNERGFVEADSYQRTANANVYAVGDVVANTPNSPTWASPKRSWRSSRSWANQSCPWTTTRALGYLLEPEVAFWRPHRSRREGKGLRGRREEGPLRW